MSVVRAVSIGLRMAAGAVAVARLAKAAGPAPPVRPTVAPITTITVVIPARDEATRIGPLLDAIVGAPGVGEVIVVDDQSSDSTAALAVAAGATVVPGSPLPPGWAGKAWALQQGIRAAQGDWIVTLDADTRPDPRLPTALVARAIGDRIDLLTVGGTFVCPTRPSRWLHASMLTTLVYRFGPPGTVTRPSGPSTDGSRDASTGQSSAGSWFDRPMANGQCMTFRRTDLLDAGGMEPVAGDVVEDVALARHLAATGRSVGFLDGHELLRVRMFETIGDVWRGWGRSLALPGVENRRRQLVDLAVVVIAQALPLPRILFGRGDVLDVGLLAVRFGTLVGTRRAYDCADLAYWSSPLADLGSAVAIARGIGRRNRQSWRGRDYA